MTDDRDADDQGPPGIINHDQTIVLEFDNDDAEFRRGVEVGMMFSRCYVHRVFGSVLSFPKQWESICHASNMEMALRVGQACGFRVIARDVEWAAEDPGDDDEWIVLIFQDLEVPHAPADELD